jgi:phosphoribosyl 1,2-cyclic phosphodiesterase
VTDGKTRILIECGVTLKELQRFTKHTLSSYDACFISHAHKDHSKGAADLANKIGVSVYCSEHTAATIDALTVRIRDGETKRIGTIDVRAFAVEHLDQVSGKRIPTLGFALRTALSADTLVFVTDTFYIPGAFDFSPTIFAIECNYAPDLIPKDIDKTRKDRLFESHMSLTNCIGALKANDLSKCREIHLLHLSQGNGDPERFVKEVEAATGIATYAAPPYTKKETR